MMVITFYNKKGGVGKTNLSYCVARELNAYLLSNDDSLIEIAYPGKALIKENIYNDIKTLKSKNVDVIVDLGGFITEETSDILKISDLIIIPTISDMNSMKRTIATYKESVEVNNNVIIAANIIENREDIEFIEKNLGLEVSLKIPKSKIFHNALKEKLSFQELIDKEPLNKHRYKKIIKSFGELNNKIKITTKLDK
jgi:cellulose biosynthesis protein BcsQ